MGPDRVSRRARTNGERCARGRPAAGLADAHRARWERSACSSARANVFLLVRVAANVFLLSFFWSPRTGTRTPSPRHQGRCAPCRESRSPRRQVGRDPEHAQRVHEKYAVLEFPTVALEALLHHREPPKSGLRRTKCAEDGFQLHRQGCHVRMSPREGLHEPQHLEFVGCIDARERRGRRCASCAQTAAAPTVHRLDVKPVHLT